MHEQHNRIICKKACIELLHDQLTSALSLCNAGTGTFPPPDAAEIRLKLKP